MSRYAVSMVPRPESRVRTRQRRRWLLAFILIAVPAQRAQSQTEDEPPPFRVIVNSDNPLASLSTSFVTQAFLKTTTEWPHGVRIRPVDLDASSPVRARFSNRVLKRSVEAVRNYWQQRIFSGRGLPPPELNSDRAVVEYVASHRGGIGYVGPKAKLNGVRAIIVQ